MEIFDLPITARVNKVIPKNAFEAYANTKQIKLFKDLITRISWLYKLSPDTLNLEAKEIKEIQVFKIEVKVMEEIRPILDIIDKAIPYNIVFIIVYDDYYYLSTSVKHPHPVNENNAVIDWNFRTEWFLSAENKYSFNLKNNLTAVYKDFCVQLSGMPKMADKPLQDIVQYKQQIYALEKEISRIKSSIANCKQFNKKVELNLMLNSTQDQLHSLI